MLAELKSYIHSMEDIAKKDDVLTSLNNTMSTINRNTIPLLDKTIKFFKDNDVDITSIKISKDLNTYSKLNASNIADLLSKIRDIYKDINKHEGDLIRLVNDNFEDLVSRTNITARETAILKTVDDVSDMTSYIYDYIYLLINRHPLSIDENDNYLSKAKVNEIYKHLYVYANMLNVYSDFSKYVKSLSKVADIKVTIDSNDTIVKSALVKFGRLMTLSNLKGFRGNPIYHIGMWFVDREVKQYESLKDKQKMTELKILELQAKANNSDNPRLSKQIIYYEDKLKKIEYNIREIESK